MGRGVLTTGHYLGVDLEDQNIEEALVRIPAWAAQFGLSAHVSSGRFRLEGTEVDIQAEFAQRDVVLEPEPAGSQDVLLAHAFLDLVDLPTALESLLASLLPGGIFYFTLVFDGLTILEPQDDPELDSQIMRAYHETMDRRVVAGRPSGDSRSGRHLFTLLRNAGAHLLEAGSSDWIVFPRAGQYAQGESEFLDHILWTIETALTDFDYPEPESLESWVATRRDQLKRKELTYVAHQLDFLGQVAARSS